ncbi:MAG: glutamate--tRNA ligase family protein, partial [Pseudomonadota bacterium]
HVAGWDDPRMPTLSGLRRRGYPPEAIVDFAGRVGITKSDNTIEYALLEHCVRQDLNKRAERRMAVINPLKVIITNYPEGESELLDAVNNPEDEAAGSRQVPFSRELWIERDDFMEDAPKKFFRLAPGREVRLRWAYFITCNEAEKNDAGDVVALHCTYDPATKGGNAPDGRKVKGTLHWVSVEHAVDGEVRDYAHLFRDTEPNLAGGLDDALNPDSLTIVDGCKLEPSLVDFSPGVAVQFERIGYFAMDPDGTAQAPVFNKTVGLRDTWAKQKR